MSRAIIIIVLCVGLSACATLVDTGDKLYAEGLYQEAAEFYEKALAKNPNNADATLGLTRARNKIIDRGLIEVRMLRLASNQAGAATRLETLLSHQAEWNVTSSGAMWVTQNEEIEHAERWLRSHAKDLVAAPFPDKFRWFQHSFPYLISNAQLERALSRYEPGLREAGQARCTEMAAEVRGQRFFLKQFAQKYCLAWGSPVALSIDAKDHSRYASIDIQQQLQLSMREQLDQQKRFYGGMEDLKRQFRQSLWFAERGDQRLELSLSADIELLRTARQVRRSKHYTVTEVRKDPNDSDKTHEVSVDRTHSYRAMLYEERYLVDLAYHTALAGQTVQQRVTDARTNRTESHDESFRAAGLYPQQAEFLDTSGLLGEYLDQLSAAFQSDLNRVWRYQFCERDIAEPSGEHVLRCGKVDPDHAYVNTWFKQRFGIDYRAMTTLYAL